MYTVGGRAAQNGDYESEPERPLQPQAAYAQKGENMGGSDLPGGVSMSVKEQYKHFRHILRCFGRRWREQGIEDATAAPDWGEYERVLDAAATHFIPLSAGHRYGFYCGMLKKFVYPNEA